jgi:hypothetical protein
MLWKSVLKQPSWYKRTDTMKAICAFREKAKAYKKGAERKLNIVRSRIETLQ